MPESFTKKVLEISVTLAKGSFAEGGNTLVINDLACDVSIQKPGLPEKNSASIKVWGLKLEKMAQLTSLAFKPLESQHNLVTIKAGEKDEEGKIKALSLVFEGEISNAFADFSSAPDVSVSISAESGTYPQQKASPPITIDGEAKVEDLFKQFAALASYEFENHGVSGSVKNSHFPGSPIQKLEKLGHDIGCELIIDDGKVIVMPAGNARLGGAVNARLGGSAVLLSKDTGLIGYPSFNQDGISCKCLFNPLLKYGGLIQMNSIVPRASGVWRITKLSHSLSANKSGSWQSEVEAAYYG